MSIISGLLFKSARKADRISSRRRRAPLPRLRLECLEDRLLLSLGITEFPTLTSNTNPTGITTGPDGNLWFTEALGNQIGRITPGGAITEFKIPTDDAYPFSITTGPDRNLWFTEQDVGQIGRITPSGTVTEFK